MARPRIFISSTFYDLKYVREDLERFVRDQGFEAVLFEHGQVPYGSQEAPEEYCYKEIDLCDILVSIVGGRYGSESSDKGYSISQKELRHALDLGKQVYIFIEKNIQSEYETYKINKENKQMNFRFVDDRRVYEFLDELELLPQNNAMFGFDSSRHIVKILKEQWAGLFQRLLQQETDKPRTEVINELRSTVDTLQQIVSIQSKRDETHQEAIKDIVFYNHPVFSKIRMLLKLKYKVVFVDMSELKYLLSHNLFEFNLAVARDPFEEYYEWTQSNKHDPFTDFELRFKASKSLFDKKGKLKQIPLDEWDDTMIRLEKKEYVIDISDEDLPF